MSHANRGIQWQRRIEVWNDLYRKEARAVVFKLDPPIRLLSEPRGGRFEACFRADGPPDFAGVARGIGAVCFDAKECAIGAWSFRDLPRHQARDLESWQVNTGSAFVALHYRRYDVGFVIPWTYLGARWWAWHDGPGSDPTTRATPGTASVSLTDAQRWGYPMPALGDWLGALERAAGERR